MKCYFKPIYISPWLYKIFKSMIFRLLEKAFATQKIESRHFYSCPQEKNFTLGSYHQPQGREKSVPP